MKMKSIMLACCLLSVILLAGAVSASDDTLNVTDDESDSVLESSENSEIQEACDEDVLKADDATFTTLQQKINDAGEGSTIILNNSYRYDDGFDTGGIVISKSITIDGRGFTLDANNKARVLKITGASNVVIKNLNIQNGFLCGHIEKSGYNGLLEVYVMGAGSGIYIKDSNVTVTGCTFYKNNVEGSGGAIYAYNSDLTVTGSDFIENQAINDSYGGGAIYAYKCNLNVYSSNFYYNNAIGDEDSRGGAISVNEKSTIVIKGCDFTGNFAVDEGGAICTFNFHDDILRMTIEDSNFNDNIALRCGGGIYICKTLLNVTGSSFKGNMVYAIHAQQGGGATVRSTTFTDNEINVYESNVDTTGCGFYYTTQLVSKDMSVTYNANGYLVITLKDSFERPVSGVKLSTNLKGFASLTTDSNGQVKIPLGKLAPKTYDVRISFKGASKYLESSKTVKVTVKKATPKLTAKAKSFKKSVKTKKYTVTLKDNINRAIKNVKVTLKINGKTYTAKTDGKGKATFKIKKLSKKGSYKSTVTYKGDGCYNKVVKKVKIKVK